MDNLAAYHVWTFFKVTKWIKWNRKQIKSRQRTQGLIFTKRRHSFCNWTDPFHVKINGYCLLLLLKLAILRKVVDFVRAQKIFGKLFAKKSMGWQKHSAQSYLQTPFPNALFALPLVLINHSNTPAEAIQTWMSAGNPYPHSSCCRKVPLP